jgi:hypothetical protein
MLREHDVKVITFPPHTTQVFQAIDLTLFGVLKRKWQDKLPLGNYDRVVGFIQKAFHLLKQTFVPDNVRNAFKMLGFEFNIAKSPSPLLLREEKLAGSQGFREIWDGDYPLNQLLKPIFFISPPHFFPLISTVTATPSTNRLYSQFNHDLSYQR